jgi:hypothetical protein
MADTPAVATIADDAFHQDELFQWLYPYYDKYPNDLRRWWLIRLKQRLNEPGVHVFVAEQENEVVGYAIWRRVGEDSEAEKWQQDSLVSFALAMSTIVTQR